MQLIDVLTERLQEHFMEVLIHDNRGDGHFLQMFVIDPVFSGKTLIERSRIIFTALGDVKSKMHAYSVKGFTPEEWEEKKDDISLQEYKHLH